MKKKNIDRALRKFRNLKTPQKKGLIVINTGDGKGKTTAAFGTVFRALGRGYRVAVVQFIKGPWNSGEVNALKKFGKKVEFHSVGEGFTWLTQDFKRDQIVAQQGWEKCLKLLREKKHDLFLFDEILYALKYRFLKEGEILRGLKHKSSKAHLILTGRSASRKLISMADLVTEMKNIKHPYKKGIIAQPGIEF